MRRALVALAALVAAFASGADRPRHPNRCADQCLRQAGRQPPRASRPRAARRDDRNRVPDARPRLHRHLARRRGAAQRHQALPDRQHHHHRGRRRAADAAHRRGARLARLRPLVHLLRAGARACRGAARSPTISISTGTSSCSTCCSNTRSAPIAPTLPSIRASTVSAAPCRPRCAFLPPGGAARAFEFLGDPGWCGSTRAGIRPRCASWWRGFWHILDGTDHLLFLCCLVFPFRRLRPLVIIVTAFTVGHSISLIASAFGFVPDALWFPPLIETLIAVTIVAMALENIVQAATGKIGGDVARRWIVAFAFGHRARLRLLVRAARDRCSSPATICSPRCSASTSASRSASSRCCSCWCPRSACCFAMSCPNGSASSSCRRWSRIRPGTGCSSAASCSRVSAADARRRLARERDARPDRDADPCRRRVDRERLDRPAAVQVER